MTDVHLDGIIFDPTIYPRGAATQATIDQYADALEAGDIFPPIVLETQTNRLLDGYHRWQAHKKLSRETIEAVWRDIPDGIPAKLFAASFSTKHGDRIKGEELKRIARDIITKQTAFDIQTVARYCGVTRQTTSNWVKDIVDFRLNVRRLQAYIMAQAGMTNVDIAKFMGVTEPTIRRDVKSDILTNLTEAMLRDAVAGLPEDIDGESFAEELRQQQIFATWPDEQQDLVKRLRSGETIIVTYRDGRHTELIEWATQAGVFERVDRQSDWGNPFEIPDDGDRDTVISLYEHHYLPHKRRLMNRVNHLCGKALGCWCYPEPCHADVLKKLADNA